MDEGAERVGGANKVAKGRMCRGGEGLMVDGQGGMTKGVRELDGA